MAKSFNQKAKILILQQLLNGTSKDHIISMQDILDEFAKYEIRAERKSVYDDIAALKEFGYPVRLLRGRNGGYYLEKQSGFSAELPVHKLAAKSLQTKEKIREKTIIKNVWQVSEEEILRGDNKNVRLLIAVEREKEVREYFGKYGEYRAKDADTIAVTLPPVYGPKFFGWLTAMGSDVRIVKPRKTALAYRDYLKSLAKEYKGL